MLFPQILWSFSSSDSISFFVISLDNLEKKYSEIALTDAPVSTKAWVTTLSMLISI
jgi:hypothetical protein